MTLQRPFAPAGRSPLLASQSDSVSTSVLESGVRLWRRGALCPIPTCSMFRGVLIPVMDGPASVTNHNTGSQIELAPVPTTLRAGLACRYPTINDPYFSAVLVAFGMAQSTKRCPPLPTNCLRQFAVFQHPSHIEVFQTHDLVFDRELG